MRCLGAGILVLLSALPARAGAPASTAGYGKAFGLGVGIVQPSRSGAAPWVTASLRLRVAQRVVMEPDVAFWTREPDRDNTLSHALGLGVNLIFTTGARPLSAWAGVGAGVHLLRYAPIIAPEAFVDAYPTLALLAGVDYRTSRKVTLYAAARFDFALEDDPNGSKLYAGVRLHV